MTHFEIVTLYIGLNVLLMAFLKMNCGRVRVATKVDYGAGDDDQMARAMRVQGNAVEDVPITLIGLLALASLSAPTLLLHILGGTLTGARVLHAMGLGGKGGFSLGRVLGTIGSLLCLLVTAGSCIYFALA